MLYQYEASVHSRYVLCWPVLVGEVNNCVFTRSEVLLYIAGAYKVSAFFLAKSMATAPIQVFQITFFALIVYFMTGYQATAAKFFIYTVTLILFALTSETIGHLCAICTKTSHNGKDLNRVAFPRLRCGIADDQLDDILNSIIV